MQNMSLASKMETARQRLPLRRLMEDRQRGPGINGNWRAFKCPYCEKKGAGLFERAGRARFKCHHTSCSSGTAGEGKAWDEVGFLAHELGLNRREAFITYLKETNLWEEPDLNSEGAKARRDSTEADEYLPGDEEAEAALAEADLCPPPDEPLNNGASCNSALRDQAKDNLPPEAVGGSHEPPSTPIDTGITSVVPSRAPLGVVDGCAAVPDAPPIAECVNASPAAIVGVPTPPLGEASPSLSPTEGMPGATSAGPLAQDAALPANGLQTPEVAEAEVRSPKEQEQKQEQEQEKKETEEGAEEEEVRVAREDTRLRRDA